MVYLNPEEIIRLEADRAYTVIYTNEKDTETIINIAKSLGVDAKVIGRVEGSEKKELLISAKGKELRY